MPAAGNYPDATLPGSRHDATERRPTLPPAGALPISHVCHLRTNVAHPGAALLDCRRDVGVDAASCELVSASIVRPGHAIQVALFACRYHG
jgi:hypothetical protein